MTDSRDGLARFPALPKEKMISMQRALPGLAPSSEEKVRTRDTSVLGAVTPPPQNMLKVFEKSCCLLTILSI